MSRFFQLCKNFIEIWDTLKSKNVEKDKQLKICKNSDITNYWDIYFFKSNIFQNIFSDNICIIFEEQNVMNSIHVLIFLFFKNLPLTQTTPYCRLPFVPQVPRSVCALAYDSSSCSGGWKLLVPEGQIKFGFFSSYNKYRWTQLPTLKLFWSFLSTTLWSEVNLTSSKGVYIGWTSILSVDHGVCNGLENLSWILKGFSWFSFSRICGFIKPWSTSTSAVQFKKIYFGNFNRIDQDIQCLP